MSLTDEDWIRLGKALEPLYREARNTVDLATPVYGAGSQKWIELDVDSYESLKDAVNGICLLIGEPLIEDK